MELHHAFTVPAPADDAWRARVAGAGGVGGAGEWGGALLGRACSVDGGNEPLFLF